MKQVPKRSLVSNFVLTLVSFALLAWSFRFIQAQITTVSSVDAIVSSELTDLRAPEEGVISEVEIKTGQPVSSGELLFTLENKRVSELQVQEISGRLNQQEAELERAKQRLLRQVALLNIVEQDATNQQNLEVLENQKSQAQLLFDLKGTTARYQLARLNYERSKLLQSQGAISRANFDIAELELKQRESEVESLKARLSVLQVNQDAAQNGLSLSRTRSNYDPSIRLEELKLQIAEEQQGIQILQKTFEGTKAELSQAQKDLQRRQTVAINSPGSGVLWRLTTQLGKFVQRGESLGQVADCNRLWVDTWVDEQKVRLLQIGTPAEIKLNGVDSSITFTGKISVIRSGIGRVQAGEDAVATITPNLPRHTQVRVSLDKGLNSSSAVNIHDGNLCYIGYTAEVVFKLNNTNNLLTYFR
jgi:multidrug resistance efflux pump